MTQSLFTPGSALFNAMPANAQSFIRATQPKTDAGGAPAKSRSSSVLSGGNAMATPSGGLIYRPQAKRGAVLLGDAA